MSSGRRCDEHRVATVTLPVRSDADRTAAARASQHEGPAFRGDIQGLRAIAVSLVVVYHLWPQHLSGGYVGVDVFFVISGFLITGHLLRSPPLGTSHLLQFWARRLRRLLPASLLVLLVSIVSTVVFVPDTQWAAMAHDAIASTLYVENWRLAAQSVDYLASDDPPTALQHYWSLGVEEQFYLIWPVLLLGAALAARAFRVRVATVAALVIAVAVALSFIWSVRLTASDPSRAYFVTPTRIWELGIGALIAVFAFRTPGASVAGSPEREPRRWPIVLAWAGVVAIVWPALAYSDSTAFPGWRAAVPILGTAAVIVTSTSGRGAPTVILESRGFQFLGDISYSLYLWHWPLIVIAPYALDRSLSGLDKWIILAASIATAGWTKKYVEDRARLGAAPVVGRTYRLAGLGMAVALVAAAAVLVVVDRRQEVAREELAVARSDSSVCFGAASMRPGSGCEPWGTGEVVPSPALAAEDRTEAYADDCWEYPPFEGTRTCSYGDPEGSVRIAVVGNSHAGHWLPALRTIADENGLHITTYLASGCTVTSVRLEWDTEARARGCADWGGRVVDATTSGNYDLIVTSQLATRLVENGSWEGRHQDWVDGYVPVLQSWVEAGQSVLVIRDSPRIPSDVGTAPDCVALNTNDLAACTGARLTWLAPDPLTDAATVIADPNVSIVDLSDFFCTDDTCSAVVGGVLVFYDNSHMTATFTETLAPFLADPLLSSVRARLAEG